ncbi:glycoside hydrolase family 65 protein [Leuconostoc gelidum subsp. aenigmaticum]|uniref:glycosyl hydrolase family 65 protein n=1 Tax=Leuconostoc gelidum TaxID=1244 RepID=UPI001CC5ECED|nr:glycosyl hydrolase family 65 protein [Leuconostoc gelidum]MBZ6003627.1 glycoside hydrolase family 65 protein [Leuconostoc gelidum subsp. aenigmaticum]
MAENTWSLTYDDIVDGVKNYGRESLLSLGNGFLGWRGALVTNTYDDDFYPGLYAAGVFNQTSTPVAGRDVINEDLVNLPNVQLMTVSIAGQPLVINNDTMTNLTRQLDFKTGELIDQYRVLVDDNPEHFVDIETIKIVDPVNWHCLALKFKVTPSYDVDLTVEAKIDGRVENKNVARYRDFDSKEFVIQSITDTTMTTCTRTTHVTVALASQSSGENVQSKTTQITDDSIIDQYAAHGRTGQTVIITRVMALASDLETKTDPTVFVQNAVNQTTFSEIQQNSHAYWHDLWQTKDIQITGDDAMQKLIRMGIFHLNQMGNRHANPNLDVSVGSRGLTGEGYRGHIFWDELFAIPYYSANEPTVARSILKYRTNRLSVAEKNALSENETGAMYPWQSGMYGDEQSQLIHLNTVDNTWIPDNSRLQRHVSLAIAYNMWVYQKMTGKLDHLNDNGLEMLIQIARFWINKAQSAGDRFIIAGVMGPNEFHEEIPGAHKGGLLNNAYTNIMLVWLLNYLHELSQNSAINFSQVAKQVGYTDVEQEKAEMIRHLLKLSINSDGIVEQYEGFFQLKQLDFPAYQAKYGDIHRIDRLLKSEGKAPDDYQVIKQADFLMLIYNLGAAHTHELITQLGYQLPDDWLAKNTAYYLKRTTHGSTTSRPVFAGIYVELARHGNTTLEAQAYDFLTDAIGSDYYDIQGGTTAEGVHMGVMGETLSVIQNDYAGVDMLHDMFVLNPRLPKNWSRLCFTQFYQGVQLDIEITAKEVTITSNHDLNIMVTDQIVALIAQQERKVVYNG